MKDGENTTTTEKEEELMLDVLLEESPEHNKGSNFGAEKQSVQHKEPP